MASFTCPHCGACLTVTAEDALLGDGYADPLIAATMRQMGIGGPRAGSQRYTTQRPAVQVRGRRVAGRPGASGMTAGAGWWEEGYTEARFEQPARQPTTQGDVQVPVLQALISGAIVGGCTLALFGGVALAWRWPWPAVVVPTMAAALGTTAALWFNLLEDSRRLLRKLEIYTQTDLDGDGLTGEPLTQRERLDVTVTTNPPGAPDDGKVYPGGKVTFHSLPIDRARLLTLAGEVDDGRRKWAARSLAGCAGLSVSEAAALVEAMLSAGFLRYRNGQKNHPQGHELTGAGRALIRRVRAE